MSNIILLTHGDFSKGIAQSCRFILGEAANLIPLSITMETGIEEALGMLRAALAKFEEEEPVIILTDIPGGSTTQAAVRVLGDRDNLYLVSGMNLGLLIELAVTEFDEDRTGNEELIREAVEQAKCNLMLISAAEDGDGDVLADDDEL